MSDRIPLVYGAQIEAHGQALAKLLGSLDFAVSAPYVTDAAALEHIRDALALYDGTIRMIAAGHDHG